jgi:hypothetical protein
VLLKKSLPPVRPPRAFSLNFGPFSNQGSVLVKSTLFSGAGTTLYSEWMTVNTVQ